MRRRTYGYNEGTDVGAMLLGRVVGSAVGVDEGFGVGAALGTSVGAAVGISDGNGVGEEVGGVVGDGVATSSNGSDCAEKPPLVQLTNST